MHRSVTQPVTKAAQPRATFNSTYTQDSHKTHTSRCDPFLFMAVAYRSSPAQAHSALSTFISTHTFTHLKYQHGPAILPRSWAPYPLDTSTTQTRDLQHRSMPLSGTKAHPASSRAHQYLVINPCSLHIHRREGAKTNKLV